MKNQFKFLAIVAILLLTLIVCIASSIGANTLLGAANAAPMSIAAIAVLFRPNPTPPPFVPPTPVVNYLTFTAQQANSVVGFEIFGTVEGVSLQYSTDNGSTWNDYTFGNTILLPNIGDNVMFRGINNSFSTSFDNYINCIMVGTLAASGDITSLLNGIGGDVELSACCFINLFKQCTSLTQAPSLPSTTLADYCYSEMFGGCTSLTQAPSLPATTLASSCYSGMFRFCTLLTQAPSLPATTLTEGCYYGMFGGCTSLTQAPSLPATTLTEGCYSEMFSGCTSLTQAPSLPATTLTEGCYSSMFSGCTSLEYIEAMFTTEPGQDFTESWVDGVAQNGTFVKSALASWDVSGVNGIPNDWTVQTA